MEGIQELRNRSGVIFTLLLFCAGLPCVSGAEIHRILVVEKSHAAIVSAANLLARDFSLGESNVFTVQEPAKPGPGDLLLTTNAPPAAHAELLGLQGQPMPPDSYGIVFVDGAAYIYGQRPRSLLYAAGDVNQWKGKTGGVFFRKPAFALRSAAQHGRLSMPEYVATLGINVLIGRSDGDVTFKDSLPEVYQKLGTNGQGAVERQAAGASERHQHLADECHAADIEYYPLLYGNDFQRWSPALYSAAMQVYPGARGTDAQSSWEKGSLCPSSPEAWKLMRAYVREFIQNSHADGLYATFWDNYGIYCQCDRCTNDGLNQFSAELYCCVSNYQAVASELGNKLVVRTWSSGAQHWYGSNWVHAPGNGGPSGEGTELWGNVFSNLPADIIIQTKVYQADCQPNPPFSELLGKASPHKEIAEWQITGQTTGRFYFPASTVDHTAWTMKKSHDLVGDSGGVSLFPGGTKNSRYDLFADILNSINAYAWREFAWNPNLKVEDVWLAWAVPIYGEKAAPFIIRALRRSEQVVNRLFSALGLGNDTNSGFAGTIDRREALLKYTNRYFQKEGREALEPTLENVQRVIDEKEDCLRQIDAMEKDLDEAGPFLKPEQLAELRTRFDWLREFAQVERYLDESLWRYRYLRHQSEMLSIDAGQMKYLANAYDQVNEHYKRMFQFDPNARFSCYDTTLGALPAKPTLGSPRALMDELYLGSLGCVEQTIGPGHVPSEWLRTIKKSAPAKANSKSAETE